MPAASKSSARRQPARELVFGDLWEHDPAPETADPQIRSSYDLFIDGKFVPPAGGKSFPSINPATEKTVRCSPGHRRRCGCRPPRRAAGSPARVGKISGQERGKYLYRIARLLQDRAREFAVAETMDGGKPIKEARDFDVPMAAAHFFTTQAGPISWSTWLPGARWHPMALWGRSSRGIFP